LITEISTDSCTVAETFAARNGPAILRDEGTAVVSIPSRFRGRARRDAAAFYLSQLAQGILAGEFGILTGHDTVSVRPPDFLELDITVTRKSRVDHVSVQVRWPRRQSLDRGVSGPRPTRVTVPGRSADGVA
jgi:amphi-Trp domain-containing protein